MLDEGLYAGRGQALVKHTFLDQYLRDQLPKVGRFKTFTYVDLYAGPWQARCPDYSDTSFGIALRRMAEAKAVLAKQGIECRMIAHLVELKNCAELYEATRRFPDVEIHCHPGRAEQHAKAIADRIPAEGFRFIAIDPKGLPDVRHFQDLISAPRTEVLLNFMFQFANRFVATDKMPRLIEWLSMVAPGPNWQAEVDAMFGAEREAFVTDMARAALSRLGAYPYAPAITVDEAESDRTLYKLIYLTRHELGLKVFRDAEHKCLEVQTTQRTGAKAAKKEAKTGQGDMFAQAGMEDPNERSARLLAEGRATAARYALELVSEAASRGIYWKALWTKVLDRCCITHRELGDIVAKWKAEGIVSIEGLGPKARKPTEETHLIRLSECSKSSCQRL